MLTLTRKVDEKIAIYDAHDGTLIAYIEVRQVRKNQVRIGVEAERELGIDRWEVYAKRMRLEEHDDQP